MTATGLPVSIRQLTMCMQLQSHIQHNLAASAPLHLPVMNNPYEINTAPPTIGTPSDAATLRQLLKTPYDSVYKVSSDGKTYLEPLMLRGTPVQRISESSEY